MDNDLIDRQAAIDVLHGYFDGMLETDTWSPCDVYGLIEILPSVQHEQKWETCFDCPLSHGCPKINGCTNEQTMEYASDIPCDCPIPVQSQKGKWIDSGYGVECSLCGEWYPHASIARNQLNFCPTCGADMREGDAE